MFEEDRDFVELDRSPSKFDMPLNEKSLDDYLLGDNNQPDQLEKVTEEPLVGAATQNNNNVVQANQKDTNMKDEEESKPKNNTKKSGKPSGLTSKKISSPTTSQKSKRALFANKSKGLSLKLKELSPIRIDEDDKNNKNDGVLAISPKPNQMMQHSRANPKQPNHKVNQSLQK
jgi:hypothetical protein